MVEGRVGGRLEGARMNGWGKGRWRVRGARVMGRGEVKEKTCREAKGLEKNVLLVFKNNNFVPHV